MQHDELRDAMAIEIVKAMFSYGNNFWPTEENLHKVYEMVDDVLAWRSKKAHD